MDMSQYRELFISETREHLHSYTTLIMSLETGPGDGEQIDSLFRTAHSIKGMAASMGYGEITELAHKIEDLMDKVRKKLLAFDAGLADLLLEGGDILEGLVNDAEAGVTEQHDLGGYIQRLTGYTPDSRPEPAGQAPEPSRNETIPPDERREERQDSRQSIRVRTDVLDNLINITGELITNKHRLTDVGRTIGAARLDEALEELSRHLRILHNEVMKVRMMPFSSIADRFPRIVRDLARKESKDLDFEIVGKDIELDRSILEELADPIIHILRNAVDHGMETGPERRALGKALQGKIQLSARRDKDQVVVTIEDDGRGMDPAKLVAAAIDRNIISQEEARLLTKMEALLLTCRAGFSTAGEVTDISGRGVGMDIVRSNVRALGGTLAIDSEVGQGSKITLKLPLTVAIINVLLVGCSGQTFAVPGTSILRTIEIRLDEIVPHGRHKVYYLDGQPVPLLSMSRVVGLPASTPHERTIPLFISEVRGRTIGFVVDRFQGYLEVFVKPLGKPLNKIRGLAGGAIVGNGEVVFIVDIANAM
jgi:two-component system, chemotaxis family, sensor kinase CheA